MSNETKSGIVVELLSMTPNAAQHIEKCGRVCYQSYDKITDSSADGFVKGLINKKHLSVLEHAHASVLISGVSRALTHQLVRHRLASYSQESQRYVTIDVVNKWFVVPPSVQKNNEAYLEYISTIKHIARTYKKLCELVPREDARYLLPNACNTQIVMSGNFRVWLEMFEKRLDPHAQWEIRELVEMIRKLFAEHCPIVFKIDNTEVQNG